MTVTTEYRFGLQSVTLLATPRRIVVAAAKWLAYTVHIAVLTLLVVLLAYVIAGTLVPSLSPMTFLGDSDGLKYLWVVPLGMVLLTTFTQGIAMMARNTAGAVVLVLAWRWVLENAVRVVPKIGGWVSDYLPFQYLQNFLTQESVMGWGVAQGGLYFAVWAVAIWGLGFVFFDRRDA